MGYLDKLSSDPSLRMNRPARKPQPVAWRSREKRSANWRVHGADPTKNLKRYAVGDYEIEPLYTH